MGYDSRIYVVRKTDVPSDDLGHFYAETMATYEMCVFLPFQKLFNKNGTSKVTNCAICEGNADILTDAYGDPLRERSLDEVIDCLDQIIALDDDTAHYERVDPLLALLKAFQGILECFSFCIFLNNP
jgi:hypothetical protein